MFPESPQLSPECPQLFPECPWAGRRRAEAIGSAFATAETAGGAEGRLLGEGARHRQAAQGAGAKPPYRCYPITQWAKHAPPQQLLL
jgi:hypothetical protein